MCVAVSPRSHAQPFRPRARQQCNSQIPATPVYTYSDLTVDTWEKRREGKRKKAWKGQRCAAPISRLLRQGEIPWCYSTKCPGHHTGSLALGPIDPTFIQQGEETLGLSFTEFWIFHINCKNFNIFLLFILDLVNINHTKFQCSSSINVGDVNC